MLRYTIFRMALAAGCRVLVRLLIGSMDHDGARPPQFAERSERWWFVVGCEPGLALAFFFGDEFGSFASFGSDAVAARSCSRVCLRPGHLDAALGVGSIDCRRDDHLTRGLS